MKYLIKRGLRDVTDMLLLVTAALSILILFYVLTNGIAVVWAIVFSIKMSYLFGAAFLISLIRFAVSIGKNYVSAKSAENTHEYTFERAAQMIYIDPAVFEEMDKGF